MNTLEHEFSKEYEEHKIRVVMEYMRRFEMSKNIDEQILSQTIPMFLKEHELSKYYRDIFKQIEHDALELRKDAAHFEQVYT